MNHLFPKLCSETSTNHQRITVIYEIPCCPVWLTGQGRTPSTNQLFQGHSACVLGEVTAVLFLSPQYCNCPAGFHGKEAGSFGPCLFQSNKGLPFRQVTSVVQAAQVIYITVASVQLIEKETGYYFLGKTLCSLFLF